MIKSVALSLKPNFERFFSNFFLENIIFNITKFTNTLVNQVIPPPYSTTWGYTPVMEFHQRFGNINKKQTSHFHSIWPRDIPLVNI